MNNTSPPTPVTSTKDLSGININNLKTRQIGLSLVLLNLAHREAERISRLDSALELLESQIFDLDLLNNLSEEDKIERYKLAVQMISSSANYINNINKDISIDELQTRIELVAKLENLDELTDIDKLNADGQDLQKAAIEFIKRAKMKDS